MNSRDEYVRRMQGKLDEWNAEIDALGKKADRAKAELKVEYLEQIVALRERQTAARHKLADLKSAGELAWEDLKAGIEVAWGAMGEAVDTARSRFR
jgi:uncharacterized protein YydD (DUF2326 family)